MTRADISHTNIFQKVILPTANLTGDQYLYGTAAADTMDGGSGADTMSGLAGDDTYLVDNSNDIAFERPGEGNDIVLASVSYTLGLDIETLTLTGTTAINATGNAQGNSLIGNSGNNVLKGLDGNDSLDGGLGADKMVGGLGNDAYTVDNSGDTIVELSGEGIDTVSSSLSFSLAGSYADNLILTGSGNLNATGNSLNNSLTGNSGANALNGGAGNDNLDGKAGADTMSGGFGDDSFIVDNAGDTVIELKDQGNDTVTASVTFSLAGSFVETLILTGSANLNATGNSQANTLIGNSGNNTLNGGYGHDVLTGGSGVDIFLFGTNNGADTVTDFTSSQGDVINVHAYLAQSTAVITQVGSDTTIDLGSGNIITVTAATAADVQAHIVW